MLALCARVLGTVHLCFARSVRHAAHVTQIFFKINQRT